MTHAHFHQLRAAKLPSSKVLSLPHYCYSSALRGHDCELVPTGNLEQRGGLSCLFDCLGDINGQLEMRGHVLPLAGEGLGLTPGNNPALLGASNDVGDSTADPLNSLH